MTKLIYTLFALGLSLVVSAQSVTPSVLASSGGSGETADYQIDWTLGELAVQTLSDGGQLLTQGFHQPMLNSVGTFDGRPDIGMQIFPNPTAGMLTISYEQDLELHARMFSLNGAQIADHILTSGDNTLRLGDLPDGSYVLGIYENDEIIKTYTIEKTGN